MVKGLALERSQLSLLAGFFLLNSNGQTAKETERGFSGSFKSKVALFALAYEIHNVGCLCFLLHQCAQEFRDREMQSANELAIERAAKRKQARSVV